MLNVHWPSSHDLLLPSHPPPYLVLNEKGQCHEQVLEVDQSYPLQVMRENFGHPSDYQLGFVVFVLGPLSLEDLLVVEIEKVQLVFLKLVHKKV